MGYWEDTTVEVTYNGKTTRVAKQDEHLYKNKSEKQKGKKDTKTQ